MQPKSERWDDPGSRVKDSPSHPSLLFLLESLPARRVTQSTLRRLRTHLSTLRLTLDHRLDFTFLNIRQKANQAFDIALWIQPRVLPHLFGPTVLCAKPRLRALSHLGIYVCHVTRGYQSTSVSSSLLFSSRHPDPALSHVSKTNSEARRARACLRKQENVSCGIQHPQTHFATEDMARVG